MHTLYQWCIDSLLSFPCVEWCRSRSALFCMHDIRRAFQECIASGARASGVFAVGGVNGFSNEYFASSVHFLEPLQHLHSNMSNLVAHVWHSMKDHMTTMPEEVGFRTGPCIESCAGSQGIATCSFSSSYQLCRELQLFTLMIIP